MTGPFRFVAQLWLSPWIIWVGMRHLRKKGSAFLNFITILSILGVGLGVTAMIVVLSVMGGFEDQLEKRLMQNDLHILVTPKDTVPGFDKGWVPKDSFAKTSALAALTSDARFKEIFPIVGVEAILRTGTKVSGVVLKGIDEKRLESLRRQMKESADPGLLFEQHGNSKVALPGVFVGQEMAYMMSLIPGDYVTLISPTETEGPLESIPRTKRFVVEGIYSSGLPDQELHTVYAREKPVYAFLRKKDVVSQWEVTLTEFEKAPEVAAPLRKLAPDFRVQDWAELNYHLFASMKLEQIAMFVMLAFTVVVASFNIVTTLTLMVLEKKKEISILKAMGATRAQVGAIFLSEGLLIGVVGTLVGVVLALLLGLSLRRYEFIRLPDIFYDTTLPVTFDPLYYGLVALCALLIVLIACYYPSHRASRLHPLQGIRE